jgi:hypothetical protein
LKARFNELAMKKLPLILNFALRNGIAGDKAGECR